MSQRDRIPSLDFIRIVLVAIVFLFHANIHMGTTFGVFTSFINVGAICMDGFFLLSGFTLYYTNYHKDMQNMKTILLFLRKRLLSIYPAYLVICLFYLIIGGETLWQKIVLVPIHIPILQSTLEGAFSTSHHGGTWFISCLLFCYLLFPYYSELIKQLTKKQILCVLAIVYSVCAYIPLMAQFMGYGHVYSNVTYRALQFFIGMLLAGVFVFVKEHKEKIPDSRTYAIISIGSVILLLAGMTVLKKFGGTYLNCSFFVIPVFSAIIYFSAFLQFENGFGAIIAKSKIISYLNSVAYEFFLGQLFCMTWTKWLRERIPFIYHNEIQTVTAFVICFVIAVILHEVVTKPVNKIVMKNVR